MAVGDEGAHPQLLGEGERAAVIVLGVLRGIAASGDVAEEPERPGFVAALSPLAGKGQGSPGEFESVLEPASEGISFAEIREEERMKRYVYRGVAGDQH